MANGEEGPCRVRLNRNAAPAIPFYGFVSGIAIDPIEKKPLYHFRPGTDILSAGFVGCNLRCPFCQNWRISQNTEVPGQPYSPAKLIAFAKDPAQVADMHSIAAMHSIAYTYSEPLLHAEFLLDCMREARKAGIANVLVTNGCVNAEPAREILELCDAANIDLKCFSEETYSKILGGDMSTVTGFIRMAVEKGVHVEITTLVVPGLNDSQGELDSCRDFIAELDRNLVWHLSAYHPNYKWSAPATDPAFLFTAAERGREKLNYVYTGNIAGDNDTPCPHCNKPLVRRRAYRTDTSALLLKEENGKAVYFCASCGQKAPFFL
ncbi:MAG: AmmeMemoRadiSam system radical SAM enzyme [Treponema sp.]|nr:AmmeMemoRadiSam system radical SAM enzyme [Treponema sp.]